MMEPKIKALDDDHAIDASGSIQSDESCRCFSLDEILSATNNFDDALVIGSGGFGKVYKGFIDNGATIVAIKRLKAESNQGAEEFWTEVKMLSKLRHTHLVALIGHCNNCEEMMLVYEYMANGTLADHLYKPSRKKSGTSISHLTWEQRLDICISAARGLDYLHTGTNQSFIHRDVKPTNILLDKNWVAKISDFGLSKDTTSHSITHVTTNVKGTFGYLDPDYFLTQRLTKKSDVYAFGVVLFEVLCGRPAVDRGLEEDQINLVFWAQRFIRKGKFDEIIDPSLSGQISPHCLKYFVKVASKCSHNLPKDRPTMAEVVRSLELALKSQVKRRTEGIITKVFQGIGMDHWWRERKDMNNSSTKNGASKDWLLKPPSKCRGTQVHRRFSLAEIEAATNAFNVGLLIGLSLSGKVYKGYMDGGTLVVAIKIHKEEIELSIFESAIEVQSQLNHPHIVSFIGSCHLYNKPCVVFDYMVNGSLRDHLYGTNNDPLPWKKRLEICIGAARGLQHIHRVTKRRLAYDLINSSKILLDVNWVAKVIDFTWSWIKPTTNLECNSLSDEWDEYDLRSFGCVLFEALYAKENCVPSVSCIQKGTIEIREIDPYLITKIAPDCLTKFVNIASICFLNYDQCASMNFVVEGLEDALKLQKAWENSILK